MNKSKVAFVIVCWNNEKILKECLDSIKMQTYKNIVTFLVDNGSTDKSVATTRKLLPEAKIIEAGNNLGFAKANNIGIKAALEDSEVGFLALLNTDARIDDNWTEKIIEFSKQKPKAACLQGTTLDYYNHGIIDSTHIFVSWNGQATQGSWRDYYESEFGPKKVFGVNAAACIITRNFVEAQPFGAEFFDESMWMYLEDVDVAARATIMGWDNYLVPGARAYHMGSASTGKNSNFSLYMTFRNNSGMLLKNLPISIILKLVPRVFLSDFETFRHLRRLDKKKTSWVIPKARIFGILRSPIYIIKRRKLSKLTVINKTYLWHLMKKGY